MNPQSPGSAPSVQHDQLLSGRYLLTDVLGSGGMSVVWRAHDVVLNRTVAVKVLAGGAEVDGPEQSRMLAEAQAAAALSHPNLVNVFDYGESPVDDGAGHVPYVVMELLTGRTLAEPDLAGSLSPAEVVTIGAQVASGLAALHEHGLVHRDIKPSNVMLTPAGPKILDFGIAAHAGTPDVDEQGETIGTPSYLAPERLMAADVTPAVDVYAAGVLIYWLLTREHPWPMGTSPLARLTVPPRSLPSAPGLPASVRDICDRCLDPDPYGRPSAAELAAVLSRPGGRDATASRRRRVRVLAGVGAAVALLTLTGVLSMAWGASGENRATVPEAVPTQLPSGPAALSPSPEVTSDAGVPSVVATQPAPTTTVASRPPAPATTTAQVPSGRIVEAVGGTVEVACDGTTARMRSATPAPGFTAVQTVWGPAKEVKAVFESEAHKSEIRVKCTAEGPAPTIREDPR